MIAQETKQIAHRIKARAAELGIILKHTHALELAAAASGLRNRHVPATTTEEPDTPKESFADFVQRLANRFGGAWGSHPRYPREDWQSEVDNGDTGRGYWEWVVAEMEANHENPDQDLATTPASEPRIEASAWSDDRRVEVAFDAAPWFRQASDDNILALASCGWRGDYPADNVAEWSAEHGSPTRHVFDYLNVVGGKDAFGETLGFECAVDETTALEWLWQRRCDLWKAVSVIGCLENVGYEFSRDSDQPGLWVWKAPTDACDISFRSKVQAVRDAWRDAIAATMGCLDISDAEWDGLSLQAQVQQVENTLIN